MKYSVKDLSNILGITTSAIHFFEKENLIKANKEKNGWRYYNVVDVFRLLSYTKYKNMEMPMKAIVKQFSGEESSYLSTKNRIEEYKRKAEEKSRYYKELADSIEENLKSIRLINELLDKYEFVKSPEILMLYDDECGWISRNRQAQKMVQQCVKAMPIVQLGVIKHRDNNTCNFGYMILDNHIEKFNISLDLHKKSLKATSCLHTIQIVDDELTKNPEVTFKRAEEYAKSRGFEIIGDTVGKILLVDVEKPAKLRTYIEIWIPIK
ncbi:MerR family transcriptional regulator [Clostridium botulinum]|uniref:MerR family transcriptional regulator n=1 Tax=Clostridium botulinum TaxID=1491 RepID=UPI001967E0CD|nr:MerR family transcriptional regulator [Clostridium botulinum]MBN1058129.1 MerR family transcriptional regulator [Clostridium botulinum]MBN1061425.1 MerR family transcriptional regulator [Clostridium botulinum]